MKQREYPDRPGPQSSFWQPRSTRADGLLYGLFALLLAAAALL